MIFTILLLSILILILVLIGWVFHKDKKESYQGSTKKLKILVLCAWKDDKNQRDLELKTLNQFMMDTYSIEEVEFKTLNILPNLEEEIMSLDKSDFYISNEGKLFNSNFQEIDEGQFIHYFDLIILETCPWVQFDPELQNLSISKLKKLLHFTKLKKNGLYLIFSNRIFGNDPELTPFQNFEQRSKQAKDYLEKFYNIFNNYLSDETTQLIPGVLILKDIRSDIKI